MVSLTTGGEAKAGGESKWAAVKDDLLMKSPKMNVSLLEKARA